MHAFALSRADDTAKATATHAHAPQLVPIGGLFGFGEGLVPIPVESVAVTGLEVTVVGMPPDRFQNSPIWYGSDSKTPADAETVSICRR
jgi:hypothetical protein